MFGLEVTTSSKSYVKFCLQNQKVLTLFNFERVTEKFIVVFIYNFMMFTDLYVSNNLEEANKAKDLG